MRIYIFCFGKGCNISLGVRKWECTCKDLEWGGVGLLKYGISIYCNFILIRPCLWPGKAHLELSEVGVILHIPPAQGH